MDYMLKEASLLTFFCLLFLYLIVKSYETGPPNPDNLPEDGKLKSEMMTKDNRRYYLDLKENSRGRFLRVRIFTLQMKRQQTTSHLSFFLFLFFIVDWLFFFRCHKR